MRTYSLTVPLLERTLMVLGYMEMQYHDINAKTQGTFQDFIGIFERQNVTTRFGWRGSPAL